MADRKRGYRGKNKKNNVNQMKHNQNQKENMSIYGFNNTDHIIRQIDDSQSKRSIILPISTRSIGLFIHHMLFYFKEYVNDCDQLSRALYRLTLVQLELKLQRAMELQNSVNIGDYDHFTNIILNEEIRSACLQAGASFKLLYELIMSIGLLKKNGTLYIPRVPKRKSNFEGLDPRLVLYSNLRDYVNKLADKKTPVDCRKYFYDHSPFPGANWTSEGDPDHPLLKNRDEIMPDNYNCDLLFKDIGEVMHALEKISLKHPNCIAEEKINYDRNGEENMLFSCEIKPLSVHEHRQNIIVGDLWELENCSETQYSYELLFLFGELPNTLPDEDFPIYVMRLKESAKCQIYRHSFCFQDLCIFQNIPRKNIGFSQSPIKLPISTRGIGFITAMISKNFCHLSCNTRKFEHALYRLTLLLMEQKLLTLYRKHHPLAYQHSSVLSRLPIPISNLISVVTKEFTYNGGKFEVFVPEPTKNKDFAFDPCLITFSNLRSYVEALESSETPAAVRKYFCENSPIPGAIWNEDIENPLLLNAVEIMPPNYSHENIYADEMVVACEVNKFGIDSSDEEEPDQSYVDKYVFVQTNGNKCHHRMHGILLASCNQIAEKFEFTHMWSSEQIGELGRCFSRSYLFGEIPRSTAVENFYETYALRMLQCAKIEWQSHGISWFWY